MVSLLRNPFVSRTVPNCDVEMDTFSVRGIPIQRVGSSAIRSGRVTNVSFLITFISRILKSFRTNTPPKNSGLVKYEETLYPSRLVAEQIKTFLASIPINTPDGQARIETAEGDTLAIL